ncbi:UBC-like protein [Laetiporus sulphureus 93-53]|uniref:UBC-like protein n=1 Tax=Laetiporus sulphureus 93-53 TaxID=1314785 RepID=A0A165HAV2_9APHY|nr:UBC-like protein [Laetiporus sulphureus 93-53]KZT11482.1 UBC-like protein [Laetiporus sulphureus 93-53]
MAARAGLNKNNSAVKRIMQEARELANDPCTDYSAVPLEDDIFEWHCTLRGPSGTEFEGGLYHFRILLPAEYPFRPPSVMMLTPNGRFELNTKICISFTSYHEELWQPAWGVRTAIIGLQGFFPLKGTAAVGVGALEYPTAERKRLAALSRDWVCPRCNRSNLECLPDPSASAAGSPTSAQEVVPPPHTTQSTTSVGPSAESTETANPAPEAQSPIVLPEQPASSSASSGSLTPVPIVAPTPRRLTPPASILTKRVPTPTAQPVKLQPSSRPDSRTQAQPQGDLPAVAAAIQQSPRRPPVLLDTTICVLLVLMFALIAKRLV